MVYGALRPRAIPGRHGVRRKPVSCVDPWEIAAPVRPFAPTEPVATDRWADLACGRCGNPQDRSATEQVSSLDEAGKSGI